MWMFKVKVRKKLSGSKKKSILGKYWEWLRFYFVCKFDESDPYQSEESCTMTCSDAFGLVAWSLVTCPWKTKVPALSPAASSYVQVVSLRATWVTSQPKRKKTMKIYPPKKIISIGKWNFLVLIFKKILYFLKWNPALFTPSSKNKRNPPQEIFLYFMKRRTPKNLCFLKRKLLLYFEKGKLRNWNSIKPSHISGSRLQSLKIIFFILFFLMKQSFLN